MLTAAIVLYHNNPLVLKAAVESFLATPLEKKIFLIDNSSNDELRSYFEVNKELEYIFSGKNLGFGAGHNLILDEIERISSYHLILNPDAYFDPDVLPLLVRQLETKYKIGLIAPKIVYPNGEFQLSIRRYPRVYDFFLRRISFLGKIFKSSFEKTNYLNAEIDKPLEVEAVSGCFQLFRSSVYVKVGGFDDRYFMYMEDIDICRKVNNYGKSVLYFPKAIVYHRSEYASKKSIKLFNTHVKSILQYFLKWGIKL